MSTPRFEEHDHETWRRLFEGQRRAVANSIHPLFGSGLEALGITGARIPDLDAVNEKLKSRTGFSGRYVEGFKSPVHFFSMLARGEFPIGNFIRNADSLSYTPAPDVFHDLFGHLPYLADPGYAQFSREFGALADKFLDDEAVLLEFDRLYWFTLEFGLIRSAGRTLVFGSGIASSVGETIYALAPERDVIPFDLDQIRHQDFKIDEMQNRLFRLESLDQLYSCLEPFAERILSRGEK